MSTSVSPGSQPVSPVHAPHGPQVSYAQLGAQTRLRSCVPELQRPHAWLWSSVVPGSQPTPAVHVPHSPHEVQLHVSSHVRVRVCSSPHAPHDADSSSLASGAHTPSPPQTHASHMQVDRQLRD